MGEEEEETKGGNEEDVLGDFFEEVAKAEKECIKEEDEFEEEEKREKTFVDDDGTTYDWSEEEKRYKPREIKEEGNDDGGNGFDVREMTFCPDDDSDEKVLPPPSGKSFNEKKNNNTNTKSERKKPEIDIESVKRKREQQQQKNKSKKQKKTTNNTKTNATTSVYCENLPRDATVERVEKFFSKCGQIKRDPATLMPKIKLYEKEGTNVFSGNALVTYLLRPSVELALTVLDGAKFELVGEEVKVTEADFSKSKGGGAGEENDANKNESNGNIGNVNAKKGTTSAIDKYAHVSKEEIRKNAALLKRKAERQLGWDGFDDEHDPTKTMVVLRNIYDENDLEEARKDGLNAQTFSDELKEDVTEECRVKCGKVENAYVNANGVVTVRFKEPEGADACLQLMHNRWFGGKQLKAEMWNGVEKFIGLKNIEKKETEEEENRRLDAYAATLGQDSDSE
jgi:HIV Tat-specific factor 1